MTSLDTDMTEDRQLLLRSVRELIKARAPVAALRRLRDDGHPDGFDRGFYAALSELGVVGLIFPESQGGAGLGYVELGLVMDELGRSLAASPLWSSVGLAGSLLLLAAQDSRKDLLRSLACGEQLASVAAQESHHHEPTRVATRAVRAGASYVLDGEKRFVVDGHVAQQLLVSARGEDGAISLFLVPAAAPGVRIERVGLVDSRNYAHVRLSGVEVSEEAVLGAPGQGLALLEAAFERAAALLAAEMLGSAQAVFDMTVDYLKTRKQFGVLIGSFQALKHRVADLYAELELTRSVVFDALLAIDQGRADRSRAASIAKARASDVFIKVAAEGIQMHGGIGMTDEHDIGFYYKRARVTELLLGGGDYHRRRYATLSGF